MPVYSKFVMLPLHIAEEVICYILGYPEWHPCFRSYRFQNEAQITWDALYETKPLWRDIVRKKSCCLIGLTLFRKKQLSYWEFHKPPRPVSDKSFGNLHYVERVNIRIFSTWLRDTDSELQKLNDIWPTNYTFPSARTLAIEYYDGGSGSSTNSVEVEGEIIAAIILRACDQMPRLQKLHIDCETKDNRSSNSEFRPTVAHIIDNILTIALPKIKKLDIGSLGSWVTKSPLSMYENVGLTHLTSYKSYEADIF
ncbi:hypothetical protein BX070DRAFT_234786 [Coemansia spiralis]|nr:hypothetical protein BX070DRAFT_234786 [Coemansia spiralis]